VITRLIQHFPAADRAQVAPIVVSRIIARWRRAGVTAWEPAAETFAPTPALQGRPLSEAAWYIGQSLQMGVVYVADDGGVPRPVSEAVEGRAA